MGIVANITQHLVKSEDLNHHGTLYAGRCAEWFVEAGFVAAARLVHPEHIVCMKIHGMAFSSPVQKGEIATFTSKVVFTGKSRMVAYIEMSVQGQLVVRGFITFVNVDATGKAQPHGVQITAVTPEDKALEEEARGLDY